METELNSQPRVNSALLSDFIGRNVRLVCKVERVTGESVIVRATDLGQVEVKLSTVPELQHQMTQGSFVEVIGSVGKEANTIVMHGCIPLGDDLDMNLVNDCIIMTHDPRFQSVF